jgi:hypothetical protein
MASQHAAALGAGAVRMGAAFAVNVAVWGLNTSALDGPGRG